MKQFIKKLLIEQTLLSEKLAEVDEDVDLIYNMFFKDFIDHVNKTGNINYEIKQGDYHTSMLKSSESTQANSLNPCTIIVNSFNGKGNGYLPYDQIIYLSLPKGAIDYINYYKGVVVDAVINLTDEVQKKQLASEFTEHRIKGSIHHELAHWLDDTFHNGHLKKFIGKAMAQNTRDLKGIPVNSTFLEIEGQIHNIKQLHNKFNDKWDEMTFTQVIDQLPSLSYVYKTLDSQIRKKWLRNLKTRMYREGLLGKNMVNN